MKINKNICKSFKVVMIKISSGGGDGSFNSVTNRGNL